MCVLLNLTGGNSEATDFGIKIGLSSTSQSFSFTDTSSFDTRRRIGPEFGFFAERKLFGRANISVSAKLVEKGMVRHFDVYNDDKVNPQFISKEEIANNANYVSLALLTKFYLSSKRISYYLIAGPRVDIKYGSKEESGLSKYYDGFNAVVMGGSIGVGVGYGGQYGGQLFIEIIYNPDFQKAFSDPELKVENSSISFLFGFKV